MSILRVQTSLPKRAYLCTTAMNMRPKFIATSLRRISFILILILSAQYSFANEKVDSLIEVSQTQIGFERAMTQRLTGIYCYNDYKLDSARHFFSLALHNTPKDSVSLQADIYHKIGQCYYREEDLPNTRTYYQKAADIYETTPSLKHKFPRQLSLIGRAYYDVAEYDSAMVYYLEAKRIYEDEEMYNEEYGYLLHFIGSVHKRQENYDEACKYYFEEIDYGREHGFRSIEAEGLYLSCICIDDQAEIKRTHLECLSIYEEEESGPRMIALMYQLLAEDYSNLGMIDSALFYQMQSLEIHREQKDISHLAAILDDIGGTLTQLGRYSEAEKYLDEALEVAAKTGVKQYIRYMDIYGTYYELNYAKGNFKEAIDDLSLMYIYRDSATHQEHQDAIQEMQLIYNTEKQEAELEILKKDNAIAENEKRRAQKESEYQSTITSYLSVGGIVVLLLGIFVFIKYRESQKQKALISEQKKTMEFQKALVEEKNKDITDSMVYASSIQKAIITSDEYFKEMFRDFFVIYKPRDIVSGDFYWAYETKDGKKLIAVGDCTGHGVPGAMMSMLGTAFLNEIVIERKTMRPALVLEKLREQVKRALQNNVSKDGMDMSFCLIEGNKMTFAGANLPVYVVRNGDLTEIKGDKQPVGYQPTEEKPFTEHVYTLEENDKLYLFSDGYADQFGGEKGKKYKYKTFRDRLKTVSQKALDEQCRIITEEFDKWKGELEQLDDVCVIGVQI